MSGEEDIELREFVTQTLQLNGYLAKLRAQLRANVFFALEEEGKRNKQPYINAKVQTSLETSAGQLMFCVVKDFLDHFNLDVTKSVFSAESSYSKCVKYEEQQKIRQDLGLDHLGDKSANPILLQLIQLAQKQSNKSHSNNTEESQSVQEEIQQPTSVLSSAQSSGSKSSEEELDSSNKVKQDDLNGTYLIQIPNVLSDSSSSQNSETGQNSPKSVNCEKDLEKSNSSNDKVEEENVDRVASPSENVKFKGLACEPVALNKSHSGDLLPSLYRECKEKVASAELDNFDLETEYEEDFMSGSELKYSVSKSEKSHHLSENTSNSISVNSVDQLLDDSSWSKTKLDEADKQTNNVNHNSLPNSSASADNY